MKDADGPHWPDARDARGNLVHIDLCLSSACSRCGMQRLELEGGRQGLLHAGLGICIPRRSKLHQHPQGPQTKEGPKFQALSLEDADSVGVEILLCDSAVFPRTWNMFLVVLF